MVLVVFKFMVKFFEYFKQFIDEGGFDLYFVVGFELCLCIYGDFELMQGCGVFDSEQFDVFFWEIVMFEQWQVFDEFGDFDFVIGVFGVVCFCVNYF